MSEKYKVWECKIVVRDQDLPSGFDSPPRYAAVEAIKNSGIDVLSCFSGWGGKLTAPEKKIVDKYYGAKTNNE